VPDQPAAEDGPKTVPAAERRRAAVALISVWTDLARDLVLVGLGERGSVRHPDLLEELDAVARGVPPAAVADFLGRLGVAEERLDVNVAPELLLDSLVLAWPARRQVA
jgi:hypothetical protein